MKRIPISLPDELAEALERASRRERASLSEITRKALEVRLGRQADTKKYLPFVAIVSSDGKGPYARDMEDVLVEEWTIDRHRG